MKLIHILNLIFIKYLNTRYFSLIKMQKRFFHYLYFRLLFTIKLWLLALILIINIVQYLLWTIITVVLFILN